MVFIGHESKLWWQTQAALNLPKQCSELYSWISEIFFSVSTILIYFRVLWTKCRWFVTQKTWPSWNKNYGISRSENSSWKATIWTERLGFVKNWIKFSFLLARLWFFYFQFFWETLKDFHLVERRISQVRSLANSPNEGALSIRRRLRFRRGDTKWFRKWRRFCRFSTSLKSLPNTDYFLSMSTVYRIKIRMNERNTCYIFLYCFIWNIV